MNVRRAALLLALLLPLALGAQEVAKETKNGPRLPAVVSDILARAQIPQESVALLVKDTSAAQAAVSFNADKPMNPASVIKLLTTYAALEMLGPAATWKTEVLTTVADAKGPTLAGDLVFKGSGDPKFSAERLEKLLKQLIDRGINNLRGDLVLDTALFEPITHDPATFDGEPLKAYNAGPDALMLQGKAVRFGFAPRFDGNGVAVWAEPRLSQLEIVNRLKLTEGACGDWRNRIVLDVRTPEPTQLKVAFMGNYPKSCAEQAWSIAALDHARFFGGAFAKTWSTLGGIWQGAVKLAATPADAKPLAMTESAPLAEIVRDINKFSNNPMARQLYLNLSADGVAPASVARSTERVREWLTRKGIAAPELIVENGSGLSRTERISANTLAALLGAAWKSSVMPEFISSMPVLGADGTFRRRLKSDPVAGQAHVKGGTLNDVRAIAGYVLDIQGRRWIVAFMIQHPNAGLAQNAQDALLKWVAQGDAAPR
ncbi:MAG: D-alanyl-D-alanine carboxypeptidase/D-alanyl-D-alanine-endopeptidase [Betaproteobacteria bacterium]|nr:D-alanyl-D-alanine carboxypeptidase/D-alanyl-D-alanine-endopeptidase [Betaproteobacteria bacterium]